VVKEPLSQLFRERLIKTAKHCLKASLYGPLTPSKPEDLVAIEVSPHVVVNVHGGWCTCQSPYGFCRLACKATRSIIISLRPDWIHKVFSPGLALLDGHFVLDLVSGKQAGSPTIIGKVKLPASVKPNFLEGFDPADTYAVVMQLNSCCTLRRLMQVTWT
jgi:hypothetical protein